MQKVSSGLLMYRIGNKEPEFFIGHPGGPFWKDKNSGTWSIPKGEVEEGEDLFEAAKREFREETGIKLNREKKDFTYLGEIRQKSGKIVHAYGFESKGEWPGFFIKQHIIEIEFPYKSGKKIKIPELDKAGFFNEAEAKKKLIPEQFEFVEKLKKILEN